MDDQGRVLWMLRGVRLGGTTEPRLLVPSLEVRAGITGVVGPSGSGKTSLLNLLADYEQPTAGTVGFQPETSEGLGLFWSPADAGLWPHLDATQHLTMVQPIRGRGAGVEADARAEAARLLAAFHLTAHAHSRPGVLSHGERERLALARAMASGARVLVLDEPFVHVDPVHASEYWALLRAHCTRHRVSVVFSTHEPTRVLAEASAVICLGAGKVLYHGTVQDLYERPPSKELALYLGEANWLTAGEARDWIGANGASAGGCYRPHRLEIVPDPRGPLTVVSALAVGAIGEAWLRHEQTGRTARFLHRCPREPLESGARVILKLCALVFSLLLACCGAATAPDLDVVSLRYHTVPPCGTRAPAPRAITPGRDGQWIVLDNAGRVLVFDERCKLLRQWFMPAHDVGRPEGVCQLADGRILVADTHYHRLVFFDQEGRVLSTVGQEGRGPGQFIYPVRVAQDRAGHIYVAEYGGNDRVQKLSAGGKHLLSFGRFGTGPGEFQRPSGIALEGDRVFVADAMNNRVQVFTSDGAFVKMLAPRLEFPYDVVVAPHDRLYVVEYGGGCLTALSQAGEVLGRLGTPGRGPHQFATPWALAMGREGTLLVADTGNRRLVEVRL